MQRFLSLHVYANSLTCTNLMFSAGFLTLEAFSHKSTDVATTHFSFEKHYTLNV